MNGETVDQGALVAFLLAAKRATYASADGAAVVEADLPGAHQLEYRDGDWLYRDIYFGGLSFAGQETVYREGRPLWSMVYSGGMLDDQAALGGFLKDALCHVSADRPFRGPSAYRSGEYAYSDASHGGVDRFWGAEQITLRGRLIYDLRYSGGLIR
jgi:hypothetical protein